MAKVMSVVEDGEEDVFDISVGVDHNFFANGMLVHNCHRMGSEYFSRVAGMYSSKLRLGLSATPKRSDGKEFVFMAHIGQVGVIADQTMLAPKVIPCATGFKLPLISKYDDLKKKWVREPYHVQKGKLGKVNLFLAKHKERNQQIINFIVQAYKKERHIVVFTALVEKHITPLKAMLIEAGVPSSDIGLFSRSAVPLNKLDEQKFKRVVLTTYGQCSEAIDVPSWDTAVLALPMANVKQIVGRVLREHDSKRPPVVFDLVDVHVPALVDYYHSRVKIYQSLGAHIVER